MFFEQLESRRVCATFQAGSIAVYRVGDGSAALTSAGTAVFVDEYSPTGTLLQSVTLPTTDFGSNRQLVASGAFGFSEGLLTRSTDGKYLVMTGYDAELGTLRVRTTNSVLNNRVIGRIDGEGVVDTSTALTDSPATQINSVASTNGIDFWYGGLAGGLRYTTLGGNTGTQVNTGSNSIGAVSAAEIFNGQLYFSASSDASISIGSVGTGLPTTAGQNTTPLPALTPSIFPSRSTYQFFMADLSDAVPGVDTLYLADGGLGTVAVGGVWKFSLLNGSWLSNGSTTGLTGAASGARGLTGSHNGSVVTLVGTSETSLFSMVDTSGYNGSWSPSSSPVTTLIATAGTNKLFRGVALSPIAETVQVGITPLSASKPEGNSGTTPFTFTVTRTGVTTGSSSVDYALTGAATDGVVEAADFAGNVLPSGTVNFAIGETSKTVTVDVVGDTTSELDEGFVVTLSNPIGTQITVVSAAAMGSIKNDDFQTLAAGDVVITGINGTDPDQFSFVPLVNLQPGTKIEFTSNAWNGTALTTNEGNVTYTAPAMGLPNGTKVVVNVGINLTLLAGSGFLARTGSFAITTFGDNLFAHAGASTAPNFLFGVTTWGAYVSGNFVGRTFLPFSLSIGSSAIALGPTSTTEVDNAQYDHVKGTTGSPSEIRTLVADRTNWIAVNNSAITLDVTNFTLIAPNSNPVVAANSSAVSGDEGTTINNTGTWLDPDAGNVVTLTASVGMIVKNANGTWDWSLTSTDQISTTNVTITANDGLGGTASTTFTYSVNNVAPAMTRANPTATGNVLTTLTNTGTYFDVAVDTVTLTADFGTIINNGNGTWSWSYVPTTAISIQTVTITGTDEDGGSSTVTFEINSRSTVSNRGLFYAGATGASAIADLSDKIALLPGQASTFANYSNYSRGLNGLVVDVVGLPASTTNSQMLASLRFGSWNGIASGGFVALPVTVVPTVNIVSGGGAGGSTRVRITFADNAIQNTWLQVTVASNANTGLAVNDVFYFGNVLGELDFGNTASRLRVNGQDAALLLANQSPGANSADVTNKFDLDRNGRVNGQDYAFLLANQQAAGIVAPITAPSSRPSSVSRSLSATGGGRAAPIDATISSSKPFSGVDRRARVEVFNNPITGGTMTYDNSTPADGKSNEIDLSGLSYERSAMTKVKNDSTLRNLDALFASLL